MASVDQVQRDTEVIEAAYVLWNTGDMATIAERYWAENIEWHDPPGVEDRGIFVGETQVMGRIVEIAARLGLPKLASVKVTSVGNQYVVELEFVFRIGAANISDMSLESIPYVHVVRLEGDRVQRILTFSDAAAAFAAAAETRADSPI
ncbi:MAG: hypothetical protein QOG62_2010 [Thermoleophilaceae bacterium]|jgi:hypothetical protein|nr:hypothetical protein [Thermoleophilaceae bacterium]